MKLVDLIIELLNYKKLKWLKHQIGYVKIIWSGFDAWPGHGIAVLWKRVKKTLILREVNVCNGMEYWSRLCDTCFHHSAVIFFICWVLLLLGPLWWSWPFKPSFWCHSLCPGTWRAFRPCSQTSRTIGTRPGPPSSTRLVSQSFHWLRWALEGSVFESWVDRALVDVTVGIYLVITQSSCPRVQL